MKKIIIIFLLLNSKIITAQTLFTQLKNTETNVDFVNFLHENKYTNIFTYEYLYNGGGVAIGDINNDGLSDIYFSGTTVANKLYLNLGNLKFKDITQSSNTDGGLGIKTGVTMVDINNDGWLDIFVCKAGLMDAQYRVKNVYINNKNSTFTDRANEFGLSDSSHSTQAYFYDLDKDGDIDLFLQNHPTNFKEANNIYLGYNKNNVLDLKKNIERQYVSNRYFENINGKYIDKTFAAGLDNYAFGLSTIIDDFNGDAYPDIYTCNDFIKPDNLYINNKNGTWTDKLDEYFKHISYNSMGSDYADINNDGYNDLFIVDMLPEILPRQKQLKQLLSYDKFDNLMKYNLKAQYVKNVLQLNNNGKSFSDIGYYANMAFSDWSWAPLIADFDNDGWKDVYITNGYLRDLTDQDYMKFHADSLLKELQKLNDTDDPSKLFSIIPSIKIYNYYYKNNGTLKFTNQTFESGLTQASFSNGAAYADLDNDGDLEIIVNNINDYAFIFKNNTRENQANNFVRFQFADQQLEHGATIEITLPNNTKQYQTYNPTKGYLSKHESFVHFGLGKEPTCTANIKYANGGKQTLNNIKANATYTLSARNAITITTKEPSINQPIFKDITKETIGMIKHQENEYIDFKQEPLLPKRLSQNGPALCIGDVNKDGLDDFFIGGAAGYEAKIYSQDDQGKFKELKNICFAKDKKYEDINAAFFDADADADLDLLVVSGGNEFPKQEDMYPARLYLNNGKGIFTRTINSIFPNINTSAKAIAIADIDNDKDLDIFIGGRSIPGAYGLIPKSYLLINNNGKFEVDHSNTQLQNIGMVTDAKWIDDDSKSFKNLILVGDWMPITLFKNNNGKLNADAFPLSGSEGWWQSIFVNDFNKDGKQDLIFGNNSPNSRYYTHPKEPLTMTVNDFDKNGSTDCIINTFNAGKNYPIAMRENVLDQMVFLKKKYTRYSQYANTNIQEMFSPDQLSDAKTFYCYQLKSLIAINNGNDNFDMKPLPQDAQLFPVQGCANYNTSENKNLILIVGNDYSTEIESGRSDAGHGLVYSIEENNKLIPMLNTGFDIYGDSRKIIPIIINKKQAWIIGKNNDTIQIISSQ